MVAAGGEAGRDAPVTLELDEDEGGHAKRVRFGRVGRGEGAEGLERLRLMGAGSKGLGLTGMEMRRALRSGGWGVWLVLLMKVSWASPKTSRSVARSSIQT